MKGSEEDTIKFARIAIQRGKLAILVAVLTKVIKIQMHVVMGAMNKCTELFIRFIRRHQTPLNYLSIFLFYRFACFAFLTVSKLALSS
jgi:hypothetical protein